MESQPRAEAPIGVLGIAAVPAAWLKSVRGDLIGGSLATVVTIPLSIGFGLLAFAPLGPAYVTTGIIAGLYGAIFLGLIAVAFGSNSVVINIPRSLVAFMVASVALHFVAGAGAHPRDPWFAPTALMVAMAFAGLMQLVFGLAGFGALMKFIPSPVMAGFQDAAALLIAYSQVNVLLGLPKPHTPIDLLRSLPQAQWPTALVGIATMLVIWQGGRITRRVPPALTGLAAGTALYYLLSAAGLGGSLGPVIGTVAFTPPDGRTLAHIVALSADPAFVQLLPALAAAGFSVAVVASLDFLMCARIFEGATGRSTDGNAELRRIGIANLATALLGGLIGSVGLSSSTANIHAGARSGLSALVHSLVILLAALLLPPLLGRLPLTVVAALLVVTAIRLFDRWTLQLARKVVKRQVMDGRRALLDLVVIATVAVIAMLGNIVAAVATGVAIAIGFFVFRMSRSVIRREYRGGEFHSRRTRGESDMALLAQEGAKLLVLELEGPLFFGSAELLAKRIDAAVHSGARCVILDFRRVKEVDSTGAFLIAQANDRMAREGRLLLLSGVSEQRNTEAVLRDSGVLAAITHQRLFADLDHAMEWAEDELLAQAAGAGHPGHEFPFERMDLLRGFEPDELEAFRAALQRRSYSRGQVLVQEGEEGHELFLLARGSASVHLRLPGRARRERIVTFSAGTSFGEFALLDRETRSATVEADGNVVCYVLRRERFEQLVRERRDVAVKLLCNLGRELSLRLRRANRMLAQID